MEESNFRLILKQNDEVIFTSMFNNDNYTYKTLSAIDVRHVLPDIFKDISLTSSKRRFDTQFNQYNLLTQYANNHKFLKSGESKLDQPKIRKIDINGRIIKGVEIALVFYINNNVIFDRTVYVDRYNPEFRFSNEIAEVMNDIKSILLREIKKIDVYNIYGENLEYSNVWK